MPQGLPGPHPSPALALSLFGGGRKGSVQAKVQVGGPRPAGSGSRWTGTPGRESVRASVHFPEVSNPGRGRRSRRALSARTDPRGSLGRDTRHSLRRPRPAPDKELQLRAGERGGRQEPGWPRSRRGADKGARPTRRPAPPTPRVPPAPWPRPGTLCRAAPLPACRHVRPRGSTGGTRGSPRTRLRGETGWAGRRGPAPRSSRGGGCSLDPGPSSPRSLPEATGAHSPRGRPESSALCGRSRLVLRPELKPGDVDAGGGARVTAGLGPSKRPPSRRALPSRSPRRGRAGRACPPRRLGALSGSAGAPGPRAPSGAARGPQAATATATGVLLAGAQAAASERGRAGRGRGAGRPD